MTQATERSPRIHPTAVVHASARISPAATVGPWCVVGPEVSIGDGTVLDSHVVVESNTRIGRDNRLFPFSYVGGTPQDKKFHGEDCHCEIGDRNQIREHVTIHRGTANGGGWTRIGSDNLIMGTVHIAHDCIIGNGCVLANNAMLAGHSVVQDHGNLGGGAGIHHFVVIGTCAFVGAMARVSMDVPPFMIVEGNPAEVRGHNHIAMARRGFTETEIEAMKEEIGKPNWRKTAGEIIASELESKVEETVKRSNQLNVGKWELGDLVGYRLKDLERDLRDAVRLKR